MSSRFVLRSFLTLVFVVSALMLIGSMLNPAKAERPSHSSIITCAGSIQACIDAATDGDTIVIPAGTYTESLTLSKPVSLTGVNSTTTIIHAVANQRVLTVTGATISNSVVISGLTFTGGEVSGGCPTGCGGGILIDDASQPTLNHIIVASNTGEDGGGGIYVNQSATIVDALFDNNQCTGRLCEGGGIYMNQSATIVDTLFENNQCTGDGCAGGGVFASPYHLDGSVIVSNTAFVSNTAYGGGGIFSYKPIVVSGGRFESNTATDCGGAIWADNTTVYMSGTDVISNTLLGGPSTLNCGVGIKADQVTLDGGRFEGNRTLDSTQGYGGAVDTGVLIMTDTQFINNVGALGGGALAGYAYLNGGRFEGNMSYDFGGGLAAGTLSMSGTEFISNTSNLSGGGVWFYFDSPSTLVGGLFKNNRALDPEYGAGGGLAIDSVQAKVVISGTRFSNNSAATIGGGLYSHDNPEVQVINALFTDNTADVDGAAIAVNDPGQYELLHLTIASTGGITRSAIAVYSATVGITDTIITSHTIGISNTGGMVYEDYNLFFGNITNTVGVTSGGHSLIGDPRFVDPARYDYHLRLGSPAIDHGIDAGVYTDLDGHMRPSGRGFDIGAYEYPGPSYLPIVLK